MWMGLGMRDEGRRVVFSFMEDILFSIFQVSCRIQSIRITCCNDSVYIKLIFSSRQNHIVSRLPLTSRIDIHNSLAGLLLLRRSKNLL